MISTRRVAWLSIATLGLGAAGLAVFSLVKAGPEPAAVSARQPVPVSAQDRVYTADQTSNTVTVIDPSTNTTLGTIALGSQRVNNTLSPQYLGDVGVHGLTYSPVGKRLAVTSVTSNTVHIVDTETNKVLNTTDVGRASHEGSFTADGKEFWIANRGRNTISVVDTEHGGVITNVDAGDNPSKVLMSPDGTLAYVNHITMPEITVIDVRSRQVKDHITGLASPFSSDLAISPDGTQLWAPHKLAGKTTVVDLVHNKVRTVLDTGPDTNHPNFAYTPTGERYAYITEGGLDDTAVYRLNGEQPPTLVTRIKNSGHAPHGAWPSGDGSRVYVGLEKSDLLDVIDTATNKVTSTVKIGQEPQAVVYATRAAAPGSAANLGRQGLGQQARDVPTTLPDGTDGDTLDPVAGRNLEATIRPVGGLDMIQIQARRLAANTMYQAYSVDDTGKRSMIFTFPTDSTGNTPMALSFGVFGGTRIAIEAKGAVTPVQKAAFLANAEAGGHAHAATTGELTFCDCC
ncbi:hypothetical protein [Pseudonocardia acaciae]|uniref:hypothetical protein n=1 Tax=Pseudonocardia acaciae TaxID=551276 RepID=UPI00068519FC|nr:hypothetical protein [Pseudonocardia acaciae]